MNPQLLYVVGPSGAGKDSLMQWLLVHAAARLGHAVQLRQSMRSTTRMQEPASAWHEPLSPQDFEAASAANLFAMQWIANRLRYGIRHTELTASQQGTWLMVNGSRAHLPTARTLFPGMRALHVQAPTEVLAQRLLARQRETQADVLARLQRAEHIQADVADNDWRVVNDASLEQAGEQVLAQWQAALASATP